MNATNGSDCVYRSAVLGVAFKPNTDGIRLAPAIEAIRRLPVEGATVRATDPEAMDRARAVFPNSFYSADPYKVACGADALLVLTKWEQYKHLDWKLNRNAMARPLLIDTRNILRPPEMQAPGFEYISFGRPDHVAKFNGNGNGRCARADLAWQLSSLGLAQPSSC